MNNTNKLSPRRYVYWIHPQELNQISFWSFFTQKFLWHHLNQDFKFRYNVICQGRRKLLLSGWAKPKIILRVVNSEWANVPFHERSSVKKGGHVHILPTQLRCPCMLVCRLHRPFSMAVTNDEKQGYVKNPFPRSFRRSPGRGRVIVSKGCNCTHGFLRNIVFMHPTKNLEFA